MYFTVISDYQLYTSLWKHFIRANIGIILTNNKNEKPAQKCIKICPTIFVSNFLKIYNIISLERYFVTVRDENLEVELIVANVNKFEL